MPSGQNNKHLPQLATSQVVRQLNGLVGKQRDGKQGGREESGEEIDIRMKDMLLVG